MSWKTMEHPIKLWMIGGLAVLIWKPPYQHIALEFFRHLDITRQVTTPSALPDIIHLRSPRQFFLTSLAG